MKRIIFSFIFCSSLGALASVPERDVKDLAEKISESKKSLIESESQKRKILGMLYGINQRMKKITQEKSHLTDELIHVQSNVKQLAKLIASLELQIEDQRRKLKTRLRSIYKLSGDGFLSILFSRTSSSEMDRILRALKVISDADHQLIKSYQQNVVQYKKQRTLLKAQVEKLMGIEKQIKTQENRLVREHKAKVQIVSELDTQNANQIKKLEKLRTSTAGIGGAEIDKTVADLMKPSFFERKGQLPPPVMGQIVQDFGLVSDEKHKIQISHKGWRYTVPKGSAISSIYEGKVIFSSWMKGYGHTVIIDHRDHYYSVYADIENVKVRVGDSVKQNQVFAQTGAHSRQFGEGLYFEIRHFSEPEDPARWLAKKPVQISRVIENGAENGAENGVEIAQSNSNPSQGATE